MLLLGDSASTNERAAIVLAAATLSFWLALAPKAFADDMKKELDVKGRLYVQGLDEEGLDVERFNVQGRDVQGIMSKDGMKKDEMKK